METGWAFHRLAFLPNTSHASRLFSNAFRVPLILQQELLRAIQVVGVNQVNAIGQHFGPEHRLVRCAPETHAPPLLMGLGHDAFELELVRLWHRTRAAPFKALSPIDRKS